MTAAAAATAAAGQFTAVGPAAGEAAAAGARARRAADAAGVAKARCCPAPTVIVRCVGGEGAQLTQERMHCLEKREHTPRLLTLSPTLALTRSAAREAARRDKREYRALALRSGGAGVCPL